MPTQTHLPLATRFIGGTFLLWGLLSMHGIVQALLVGRGPILDFNVFLALVGWGILRGREGARVWGVLLTGAMGVLGGIGLLVAGAAAVGIIETSDSSTLTISPNVPMATAGVLLFFFVCCGSVRHLLSETTKAAHFSRATPRKWSWGPWTWLTVLLFVAFCSLSWATEPAVQYRARKLGLVRVPSYLEGLPTLPAGRGAPVEWEGA
ncbi:MAG: hypothetical protein GY930_02110, partial [bacterium]|nr:hypothetical protein [bacterium]